MSSVKISPAGGEGGRRSRDKWRSSLDEHEHVMAMIGTPLIIYQTLKIELEGNIEYMLPSSQCSLRFVISVALFSYNQQYL
jgi:hypothetical protein